MFDSKITFLEWLFLTENEIADCPEADFIEDMKINYNHKFNSRVYNTVKSAIPQNACKEAVEALETLWSWYELDVIQNKKAK